MTPRVKSNLLHPTFCRNSLITVSFFAAIGHYTIAEASAVEPRLTIAAGIPMLLTQLESGDRGVQVAMTAALSKLADHCQCLFA